MNTFYSELIEIESITASLDKMNLSDEERNHLASLVDSSLHHMILDAILSELKEEEKIVFLQHLHSGDNDKIWKFLNEKVDNIEDKIKAAADSLKKELHQDLKEAAGKSQKEEK